MAVTHGGGWEDGFGKKEGQGRAPKAGRKPLDLS